MTAKEYLQQIRKLNVDIEIGKKRCAELRASAASVSAVDYGKPVVKSSPKGEAAFVPRVEAIIALEEDLADEIIRNEKIKSKIMSMIKQINDADCCRLLSMRYVDCMKFEQIADEMHYSYVYVVGKLHRKALSLFELQMKKNSV